MERILQEGNYTTLVLDVGDYGRDALPLLEKCQVIYTPIREDPFSAEKMREFEEYLEAVGNGAVMEKIQKIHVPVSYTHLDVYKRQDLVDFVSEEAAIAGKNAAAYVKQGENRPSGGHEIVLNPIEGVRYTVPGTIDPARMDEELTVRFRVGGVYKNCYVSAYFGDERVIHRKRPVVAPGEMEELKFKKADLLKYPDLETITVKIEEA